MTENSIWFDKLVHVGILRRAWPPVSPDAQITYEIWDIATYEMRQDWQLSGELKGHRGSWINAISGDNPDVAREFMQYWEQVELDRLKAVRL